MPTYGARPPLRRASYKPSLDIAVSLSCIVQGQSYIHAIRTMKTDWESAVEDAAERDGRYNKEAFFFVYRALDFTVKKWDWLKSNSRSAT